jgi:argininosuccinate lyase
VDGLQELAAASADATDNRALMSRFRKDPTRASGAQPLARVRLAAGALRPRPVAGARRGLRGIGVLDAAELQQMEAGLERVGDRMAEHGFQFEAADEDIHMAIERLLGEEIGSLAGKLHTGRSRNDQVATDVAMVVQAHSLRAIELCGATMERLLALAEAHRDWPMPGYTHLQRAQPVYLGHHLLAYFWMLARDVLRFQFALDSASVMPLGSGALAGVNWEIDRRRGRRRPRLRARQPQLDRRRLQPRLRLDYLGRRLRLLDAPLAARLGNRHLELTEFGFCQLDETFSSGSSIMPQKVNPDSAELLRAKSPRVAARLRDPARGHARAAADLRQGHAGGQGAAVRRDRHDEACLDAAAGMLSGIEFDRERLADASGDEMLAATEIADLLVRRGVPFREAHGIVGGLVRDAVESGRSLSELTPEDLRRRSSTSTTPTTRCSARQLAGVEADRRRHRLAPLAAQLEEARETLAAVKARVLEERA